MANKIGENTVIDLFSSDLDDLRKEIKDYSVHQLLNKLDEVEGVMTHYALLVAKSKSETEAEKEELDKEFNLLYNQTFKEKLDKEFNLLYNQTFYILQLIGQKMRGK